MLNILPNTKKSSNRRMPFHYYFSIAGIAILLLIYARKKYDGLIDDKRYESASVLKNRNNNQRFVYPSLGKCDSRNLTTTAHNFNYTAKSFDRRHLYEPCTFTPILDGGPIPVVFLVNGRSGSSNTWMAISNLAGKMNEAEEDNCPNIKKGYDFMSNMSEEEGSWWITEHLCEVARQNCDSPLAAFQWKPFVNSWVLPSGQGMLKRLASFTFDNGRRIKVIFMTRNHIDVLISKVKHHTGKKHGVPAHCSIDDMKCIHLHEQWGTNLTLPVEGLIEELDDNYAGFNLFEETMQKFGIDYYSTSFEKLYETDNAEEWMRIFRFLGRGPTHGLTLDKVHESFPFAFTSPPGHKEILKNYEEVKEVLFGTAYDYLLH